jgi:hypothetical protein
MTFSASTAAVLVASRLASSGVQTSMYERYERSLGKNCVFEWAISTPPPTRMRQEAASTFLRWFSAERTIREYHPVKPFFRRSSMGSSGLAGRMRPKAMRGMKLKETMNAATRVVVITIGRLWRNRPVSPVSMRKGR